MVGEVDLPPKKQGVRSNRPSIFMGGEKGSVRPVLPVPMTLN